MLSWRRNRRRGAVSKASDWYSVGVMLYHALTGQLPFLGDAQRVLFQDKQIKEPVPPRELVPTVPADLNELCVHLLRRLPEDRPSGEKVLEFLGLPDVDEPVGNKDAKVFVGRRNSLEQLREAYADVQDGQTVQILVHGNSGIGKSALLDRFLGDIREDGEAVVLAGRCNERVRCAVRSPARGLWMP